MVRANSTATDAAKPTKAEKANKTSAAKAAQKAEEAPAQAETVVAAASAALQAEEKEAGKKSKKPARSSDRAKEVAAQAQQEVAAAQAELQSAQQLEQALLADANQLADATAGLSTGQLKTDTDAFLASFKEVGESFQVLRGNFKNLSQRWHRAIRDAAKTGKRARKAAHAGEPSAKRSLGGITSPTSISDELANFLHVAPGTRLARVDVTRAIAKYIRENNLQDATCRRFIVPDKALAKLLRCKEGVSDGITVFTIQTMLKPHYPPSQKELKAAGQAAAHA